VRHEADLLDLGEAFGNVWWLEALLIPAQ
jgi:hypothetical protein